MFGKHEFITYDVSSILSSTDCHDYVLWQCPASFCPTPQDTIPRRTIFTVLSKAAPQNMDSQCVYEIATHLEKQS